MKTNFPTDAGFSGKFYVGFRKNPANNNAQRVGGFVLKRLYNIVGNTLVAADEAAEVKLEDDVGTFDYDTDDDENFPYSYTIFENDIAIFKPVADLVVKDFYTFGESCSLHVTENSGVAELWFQRETTDPDETNVPDLEFGSFKVPDFDAQKNMFGWYQKALPGRKDHVLDGHNNPPSGAPVFDNAFFNFYHRDFAVPGFSKTQFTPGSLITIQRGSEQLNFSLGNEQVSAKFFIYDGRGSDKQRYWCAKAIPDIRFDTLIISPDENSAYALWRGIWNYDSYPADRYRMLDVKVEELS